MQQIYKVYTKSILNKITIQKDAINSTNDLIKGYLKIIDNNTMSKDYNIIKTYIKSTTINIDTYKSNRQRIIELMQNNDNKELYLCAIKVLRLSKDITDSKVVILKLEASKVNFKTFKELLININDTIEKRCLLGDIYNTNRIGYIYIKTTPLRNLMVDWDETTKLKQLLIDQNIPLFSRENPNGRKYMIYHTNNDWPFWIWSKSEYTNAVMYKFVPVSKIKTEDRKMSTIELQNPTIDEIINNKKLGAMNKLTLIAKLHPSMILTYAN